MRIDGETDDLILFITVWKYHWIKKIVEWCIHPESSSGLKMCMKINYSLQIIAIQSVSNSAH